MKALLSFAAAAVLISAASVSSANPTPRDHDCCKAEAQIVLSLDVPCICTIDLPVRRFNVDLDAQGRQLVSGFSAECNGPGALYIRARSANGGELQLPDGTDGVPYIVNVENTTLLAQQLTASFQTFDYDNTQPTHQVHILPTAAPAVFGLHSDTIYIEISPFM